LTGSTVGSILATFFLMHAVARRAAYFLAFAVVFSPSGRSVAAQSPKPSPKIAELRSKLTQRLDTITAGVDGVVGYDIVDLTSGDRISHLENESFPTASSIKLAIVYELFKQAAARALRLDETIQLDRAKAVGGTGVLRDLGTPTLSLRDYATLMVTVSDNTATNVLIDRLGMNAINERMQALGLTGTRLRRHMMDTAAATRGDENVSTPAELARLLQIIDKELPDAIALLKKPKESALRRALPSGVESANKTGSLDGVRVDAGIVYARNRPYTLVVMTTFLKDEDAGERAIEAMSRACYDYFSRIGAGELRALPR
jgi:beta-lactamase class A